MVCFYPCSSGADVVGACVAVSVSWLYALIS